MPDLTDPSPEPANEKPADQNASAPDSGSPPREDYVALARRLGPAGILAIISMSLPLLGMLLLLGTMERVGHWLDGKEALGIAIYVIGFAVLAGLALLPTWVQAVLGGWAFKLVSGSIAAIAGYVGASMIGYVIARRASGDRVVRIIEERPKWKAVYDTLLQSGFGKTLLIVTLIRIPTNSPFALTNLVMAATRVSPLAYVLGTMIGMAPRTIVAVYVGSTLSDLDLSAGQDRWLIIAGIAVAIVVVLIIGHMANQAVARVTGNDNAESDRETPPAE